MLHGGSGSAAGRTGWGTAVEPLPPTLPELLLEAVGGQGEAKPCSWLLSLLQCPGLLSLGLCFRHQLRKKLKKHGFKEENGEKVSKQLW